MSWSPLGEGTVKRRNRAQTGWSSFQVATPLGSRSSFHFPRGFQGPAGPVSLTATDTQAVCGVPSFRFGSTHRSPAICADRPSRKPTANRLGFTVSRESTGCSLASVSSASMSGPPWLESVVQATCPPRAGSARFKPSRPAPAFPGTATTSSSERPAELIPRGTAVRITKRAKWAWNGWSRTKDCSRPLGRSFPDSAWVKWVPSVERRRSKSRTLAMSLLCRTGVRSRPATGTGPSPARRTVTEAGSARVSTL